MPAECKPYPPRLSRDQTAAILLDTQLYTGDRGSLTCNYTQPSILRQAHMKKTAALVTLQHAVKLFLPEGPIYVFTSNTCYLLHVHRTVVVVHAKPGRVAKLNHRFRLI